MPARQKMYPMHTFPLILISAHIRFYDALSIVSVTPARYRRFYEAAQRLAVRFISNAERIVKISENLKHVEVKISGKASANKQQD